jgi:hypothetical protein
MEVGILDGSVRFLSANISGQTWWALCAPRSGDEPGNKW